MIAAVILVCSLASLALFLVSYCRSLIAAAAGEKLPLEVQEVTGITSAASPEDFTRVVQLLQLCPDRPEERGQLRAIGTYYQILGFVCSTIARIAPSNNDRLGAFHVKRDAETDWRSTTNDCENCAER